MLKIVIASLVLSSLSFAAEMSASVFASSAQEVEMEMTAERDVIIKRAQPDAALYVLSEGKYSSPALEQAMNKLKQEKQDKQVSGLDLAIEILNTK